jgi:hypothetical protein
LQQLTAALNIDQIDQDAVLGLAKQIDENSTDSDEPRYAAARELLVGLGVDKVRLKKARPTAQTVSRFILYLSEYLDISKIIKLINEFPQIVCYSEENLEGKRKYLELDKKKFIELILKFPQIVCYSEENLEGKRKYLELDKKKFIELILKFPPIVSHSEENLEERRKYLELDKKRFIELILKCPPIISHSEENLEGRRKYLELDKKRFIELILKYPPIVGLSEENLEGRRKYLELDKKRFIELILKCPPIVGYGEENLERRRKYLELDKKKFIELILKFPPIVGYSEENLERKFSYYERHFGESRMDIINRVINGQVFLLSCSFYTRILLRVKYASCFMNERVETLDDVIRLINPKEDKFLKMLRGADLSEYAELRGMSEVLKNTNGPVKSKQR